MYNLHIIITEFITSVFLKNVRILNPIAAIFLLHISVSAISFIVTGFLKKYCFSSFYKLS